MVSQISDRLAGLGYELPGLEPVPLVDGVPVVGFAAAGDDALAWWRRLRGVHQATGLWPVLIPAGGEAVRPSGAFGADPAGRVARAVELDVVALLNRIGPFESQPDEVRQDLLDRWPDEPTRIEQFGLPYQRDGRPELVLVALVEAAESWQVLPLLDYGYWNDCPEPAVHGAVLRHWGEHWGAELVCMTETGLELALTRPPRTRLAALAFAWEYPVYCLDGMDLYDADDIPDLAGCLINAEFVRFWWD